MTRFSFAFHLLIIYVHAGRWFSTHTTAILAVTSIALAVTGGVLLRGRWSRRHRTPPGEQQFPTNLLAIYRHPGRRDRHTPPGLPGDSGGETP